LLQSVESAIMIPAFLDASESLWCVTRHDSLLVRERDRDKAIGHILTHAVDVLGYRIPVT
jgi:hypothetical protein